jgi:hypothetical protein
MTQEALKKMYQLLLTEPHAPTVCAQLERIAREALAEHAMQEVQRLGQEIEPDDIASILACREMLDAQPVPEVDRVIWPEHTEQEPVAFASHGVINWIADKQFQHEADLYITPPQRKPLTHEEMKKIWYAMQNIMGWYSFQEIARAIEAAHGIKENT